MSDASAEGTIDPGAAPVSADGRGERGFCAIVASHEGSLIRYAASLIGPPADEAQDLVQEAFLRLHRQRNGQAAAIESPRTWLFHVVHNLAMDTIRKRGRRRRSRPHIEQEAQRRRDGAEGAPDRLEEMERREAATVAMDLLVELPESQRRVLLLRIGEQLSIRQIAEITGSTPGNVGYRLSRGLSELARLLKQKGVI